MPGCRTRKLNLITSSADTKGFNTAFIHSFTKQPMTFKKGKTSFKYNPHRGCPISPTKEVIICFCDTDNS
jgi:hypothetical protein